MQSKVCLGRHTVYTNRRSNSNRRLMPAWFRLAWNQVRIQFRAFFILQAINKGTPLFQTPSLNVCDEEYPNIMATTCFPVDAEPSYARRHPSRQKSPVDAPRMHPPSQSTWSTDMWLFVDWAMFSGTQQQHAPQGCGAWGIKKRRTPWASRTARVRCEQFFLYHWRSSLALISALEQPVFISPSLRCRACSLACRAGHWANEVCMQYVSCLNAI